MPTTLLFVGDIHLGRQPARLAGIGPPPKELSPVRAWEEAVRFALAHEVSAVVLAGDVVDNDRDQFEAYGHLERGIQRLTRAGVQVVAVAGNHDGIVLPRLSKALARSDFRLLGEGARWQRIELEVDPPVDLMGWSFPTRHWKDSPLDSPGLADALTERRTDASLLAVLHADLDGGASSYAPVPSRELDRHGAVDAWFLGHIHRPHGLAGPRPLGYLGSLVGLDRGETGPRGPWLVTVEGRGSLRARQVQLGPVQWEDAEVDVSDLPEAEDDAVDFLRGAVQDCFGEMRQRRPDLAAAALRVVAVSVVFVGQPVASGHVRSFVEACSPAKLLFHFDDQVWTAVTVRDRTRPAVDLASLMAQRSPLGLVAAVVQALESGGELPPGLAEGISSSVAPFREGTWTLDEEDWPMPDQDELLLGAARDLLDVLLEQQRVEGAR